MADDLGARSGRALTSRPPGSGSGIKRRRNQHHHDIQRSLPTGPKGNQKSPDAHYSNNTSNNKGTNKSGFKRRKPQAPDVNHKTQRPTKPRGSGPLQNSNTANKLSGDNKSNSPNSNNSKDVSKTTQKPSHPSTAGKTPSPSSSTKQTKPATGVVYSSDPVFQTVGQVGEGTYGKVYKAVNKTTGLVVAMKRLRLEAERDGFPMTATREIKLLQCLRHPNIVRLHEMVVSNRNVYMAFEYIDHDLSGLLQNTELILLPAHIKSIIRQLLDGLAYLHHKAIVHRDIKGPNILINCHGQLKLADFGLARTLAVDSPETQYTNRVITRWYRPPELLLGATNYGPEVDMWGVGCLLVEMVLRRALFPGKDEVSQLNVILKVMGTPSNWPERVNLPWYYLIDEPRMQPNIFADVFHGLDITRECFTLASKLLQMNPRLRISAKDALTSPYFTALPKEEPLRLSGENEWHDFEAKKRRREKREATRASEKSELSLEGKRPPSNLP